jgi:hypothetical protein
VAKKISSGRNSAEVEAKFKLYYPVLAECAFERNNPPEDVSDDDKVERFYDSTLEMPGDQTSAVKTVICEFSAGQKVKETKVIEIRATYFVGLSCADLKSDSERKAALQQVAAASAWPMFRDLFIHIGSQSGEELPLLPNIPKLRWISDV